MGNSLLDDHLFRRVFRSKWKKYFNFSDWTDEQNKNLITEHLSRALPIEI